MKAISFTRLNFKLNELPKVVQNTFFFLGFKNNIFLITGINENIGTCKRLLQIKFYLIMCISIFLISFIIHCYLIRL